ncbi:Zinc finger CCHC domain-containing protein 4 [Holothuria leucospilota]|uniref:Zinc finger CCHC domain-containing protein 4 n=1 Tax=Holothuria leucospilota TaxID=206669 RepID=A0A9Q1BHQ7_HOLLE|nr:Zinc finger CCHC domain-containing protein 4 [Holothuria leucospilota]
MTAERNRNTHGIDVNISEEILARSPHCRHGPTLLFEKFTGKGEVKRYFACSAFRDHKQCRFYQPLTGEDSFDNLRKRKNYNEQKVESKDHIEKYSRYQRATLIKDGDRHYCHSCHLLVFKEELNLHTGHMTTSGIPDWLLQLPTRLMAARENNKSQAQYLFTQQTAEFLVQTIKSLGFNRVLCVGVPRLHEMLRKDRDKLKIDSLLLDIDERFTQFYHPSEFCHYNMFNHYFFDNGSKGIYESFLQRNNGDGLVLVMDPPFGGLVDALAFGVSQIVKSWNKLVLSLELNRILPVMWIFPYFMEKRIVSLLPAFTMLDYKVDYDNHSHFKNGSKSKKKSPVRIFTNISPASIVLPPDEGYRFCFKCQRYSAADNPHCKKCNKCTSKDGSTYRHCSLCHRCVKPSYTHCKVCHKCELPSHDCKRVLTGCHLCGDLYHKRKECPQLSSHALRLKLSPPSTSPSKPCVSTEVDNNLSQMKGYGCKMSPNEFKRKQKKRLQGVSRKEAHTNMRSKTMIEEYVRRRRLRGLKSTFCLSSISDNKEDRR